MEDGLYQVTYKGVCAGFVIENGRVTKQAPILKKWDLKRAIRNNLVKRAG